MGGPGGGNLLQSWGWGAFKAAQGWRPHRWIAQDPAAGDWLAACQVLVRPIAGGLAYGYCPRGPALAAPGDAEAAAALLRTAANELRRERVLRLQCDPEWPVGDADTHRLLVRCRLRELGFDVQHRQTWLVDLPGDATALMARLPSTARRNVRLAERSGVVVERSEGGTALEAFVPLYEATAARQGYVGRPAWYLRGLVAALGASVFVARLDGEPVAGAIVVAFGPRCCYLFGGTHAAAAAARPGYALHHAIMRWGLAQGCSIYDMWGVPRRFDPADPAHGYATFKTRWGGRLASHTGLLEVPLWGPLDPALRAAERLVLRRRPLLT